MANEVRLVDIKAFPLLPNKLEGDLSEYERGYLDAQANLNNLPTIDPESLGPKGRWKYDEGNLEWACSECLCAAHVNLGAISGYILSDFCPNCGAKMEG